MGLLCRVTYGKIGLVRGESLTGTLKRQPRAGQFWQAREKRSSYGDKSDGKGTYERHSAPKQYHVGKEHTQSMTKGTSPFRVKLLKAVALVALLAASTVTQGVLAAEYTFTDLGTLGGSDSFAAALNEFGQVVGVSRTTDGALHAFLYSGGTMTDLGTLGGTVSSAAGINAAGQVVGQAQLPGSRSHAFLYSGGPMTDLNDLIPAGGTLLSATDINDAGQIVGEFTPPGNSNARHAFLYSAGTITDLRTLGGTHSFAHGINAAGQVVGRSYLPGDLAHHAFLYSGGTMTDLNALVPAGVIVTNATGINAEGQIVGDGRIGRSAHTRALLLTPTPLNRFAYALADLPTAASYTPDSHYNASGGAISITRQGVGSYEVAFDKMPTCGAGASSAVAVTAYGSSPITCSVVAYSRASPSRTVAQVACFDVDPDQQRMADSRFTILVVGNQSLPGDSAFVISGGPARDPALDLDPAWNWTSIPGRWITVTYNEAPGDYDVRLGTGNTPISAKLVTGTTGVGTRCNHAQEPSGGLRVRCYDQTGAPSDQGFSVVQVAGGRLGRRLGFGAVLAASVPSPSVHHAFNSAGGAITATRSSAGHYAMHFAGLQQLPGRTEHVQVTSRGLLSTCNVVRWEDAADGLGLTVFVECRDGAGRFIDSTEEDSGYTVLVIE